MFGRSCMQIHRFIVKIILNNFHEGTMAGKWPEVAGQSKLQSGPCKSSVGTVTLGSFSGDRLITHPSEAYTILYHFELDFFWVLMGLVELSMQWVRSWKLKECQSAQKTREGECRCFGYHRRFAGILQVWSIWNFYKNSTIILWTLYLNFITFWYIF